MEKAVAKAKILMEALPWIRQHSGKTAVIKCGGKAMVDPELRRSIAADIVLLRCVGVNPVIVHGGGPEITKYMNELGKEVKFHNGLRVTDKETMEIVRMVLVGKVNKELVSLINHQGGPDPGLDSLAVGVSGDDGGLILAEKMTAPDIGFVGKVKRIEPTILNNLISDGFTPVVASIGSGEDGESYNINADQVAAAVAVALKADKMIFLTDVPGLYRDFADRGSLISVIDSAAGRKMVEDGGASEGMIPKIKACAEVVEAGIKRAHILDGTQPHALLLEIFTDEGIGTMFTPANLGEAG